MSSVAEIVFRIVGGADLASLLNAAKKGASDNAAEQEKLKNKLRESEEATRRLGGAFQDASGRWRDATGKFLTDAEKAKRGIIDLDAATRKIISTLKNVAGGAEQAFRDMNRLAGVKGFGELKQSANDLEELFERVRISMDLTKDQFEKMGAKKILFDVAFKSGKSVEEVAKGLREAQNETSTGASLLANGGKLLLANAIQAQVSEGTVGSTATTAALFSQQFKISEADQAKIPGLLFKQQLSGSLETDTAQKFVKDASVYRAATGKGGIEGFAEMMAMANVVKDVAGTGRGWSGAASAATLLGAMFGDLSKGKGISKKDNSAAHILTKELGYDVKDKDGTIDIPNLIENLAALKANTPAKALNLMQKAFRNKSAFRAISALVDNEILNKGTDKSLAALTNVDSAAGGRSIEQAHADLMGTANIAGAVTDAQQQKLALEHQGDTRGATSWWKRNVGGWLAAHPWANAALDSGAVHATAGAAATFGATKLISGGLLGGGTIAKGLGFLRGMTMTGSSPAGAVIGAGAAGYAVGTALDQGLGLSDKISRWSANLMASDSGPGVSKGNAGHAEYMARLMRPAGTAAITATDGAGEFAKQLGAAIKPPGVNVNVNIAPNSNVEARVTSAAMPSGDRAKSPAPGRVQAPGRI